uniref:U3 small nucleolar ribonucleoprotein protein IMP3 n=1 Tax=Oreochromis aureus TaxID=47969 RepID=A0A668S6F4_OREAU
RRSTSSTGRWTTTCTRSRCCGSITSRKGRTTPSEYNKLSRNVRDLARKIRDLDEKDGVRAQSTHRLLEKLYSIGLIPTRQNLSLTEKVTASSFCRRRLPSIMVNLRMAQNLKTAITFIEQGHVRVGPDVVTDPAFLVTRNMEDFVTWVDSSKIKQHVMNYNEERDDFDMMA